MLKFLKPDLAKALQNLITKYPMNEERDEFPECVSFIYDTEIAENNQLKQKFTALAKQYGFEVVEGTSIFNPDKVSFSLYFDGNVMTLKKIKVEKQVLSYRDGNYSTFFCSVDNVAKGGRYGIYDVYIISESLTSNEEAQLIATVKRLTNAILKQMYDTDPYHLAYYINCVDEKALTNCKITIK